MSSWIVSNVPAWLLLPGLMVVVAGSSVFIQIHVRRRFPALREDSHNEVTRFAFGVIGFVYGFFIGFLVNAMWSQVNSADVKAATEGSSAMQLAKDLTIFDKIDGDRIRLSLLEYERAAEVEWTLVREGSVVRRGGKRAAAALCGIPESPTEQRYPIGLPRHLAEQPREDERATHTTG